MAETTFMQVQDNSKPRKDLNLKNIGQNLIIQAFFHQRQGLFQKSKQGRIHLIILNTGIRKR